LTPATAPATCPGRTQLLTGCVPAAPLPPACRGLPLYPVPVCQAR